MRTPFHVLFRHFLFRFTDVEFLSAHAQGDSSKLLGQFASLLLFLSLLFTLPALGSPGKDAPPQALLVYLWSMQHFLIATTMLAVGVFAVLNWESILPDRRDILVLGPLPVKASTLFLARIGSLAAALALSVVLLHATAGLVWPFVFGGERPEVETPSFRATPAHDFQPMLAGHPEAAIVVGISQHGRRQVRAYGTAAPDTLFEIGSVTKTFTALLLAKFVVQGKARLDEPVRALLPPAIASQPFGAEINLLELATHRSGLPRMPPGYHPADPDNPFADYHDAELHAYLARRGFIKRGQPTFRYSNLGFGLLGQALASRSGESYSELIQREITGPLGLRDTVIAMSAGQRARLAQGHNWRHQPVPPWDLDAFAGAGALHASASELLTYLEAQLHPATATADPSLNAALALTHLPRGRIAGEGEIGLAWFFDRKSKRFQHGGATAGYTAYAAFSPERNEAIAVLSNIGPGTALSADMVGEHIAARLDGRPAVALESVRIPAQRGPGAVGRAFIAYWAILFTAGAFLLGSVICLQGVTALLLPRRLFLRLAPLLQMAMLLLLVGGYLLQPVPVFPGSILEAQSGGPLSWSPSYWFLGLLQQWLGSPMMQPLAERATVASAAVGTVAVLTWGPAYFRTVRRIVEEPGILPGSTRLLTLPVFGGSVPAEVARFSIRTLLRSRQHRLVLAFFAGLAFAISVFYLKTPVAQKEIAEVAGGNPWSEPNAPVLASTIVVLGFWLVAMRLAFALPFEMPANWVFRLTPVQARVHALAARRRAMYLAGLLPAWLLLSLSCGLLWPWRAALGHAAVLGLLGIAVAESCASGPPKLPFTCSYLPGKTNIHITFWLAIGLIMKILDTGAEWERRALAEPRWLAAILAALLVTAGAARWWSGRDGAAEDSQLQFEEESGGAIVGLQLGGEQNS